MKKAIRILRPRPLRPTWGRFILKSRSNPFRGVEAATPAQAARIRGALV